MIALKPSLALSGLIIASTTLWTALWIASSESQPTQSKDKITKEWLSSPHANIASESFTHWDKAGKVPIPCAACHSGEGFRDYIGADGSTPLKVDKPAPIRSTVGCNVCHNPQIQALARVTLPSGYAIEKPGPSSACMICHQGRTSGARVQKAVGNLPQDIADKKLRFINIHYRAAAASLVGSLGKGGYEYQGKAYHGKLRHPDNTNTCTGCHNAHTTRVKVTTCNTCHENKPLRSIRTSKTDFDGDGNTTEGIHAEIASLHNMLGNAITLYARSVTKVAIIYAPAQYPYFFADRNSNGKLDKDEATRKNAYSAWTPRLLKAAYNYQFVAKEPGIYAHNPLYGLQLLYDSISSLNEKAPVPDFAKIRRP